MKKPFACLLYAALLVFPLGLMAQNTDEAISKIRKDYALAQEKIKACGDYYDGIFINSATVNIGEMWGGSGPHAKKTEVFYVMGTDEEWSFDRTVFFVRNKYNVSVREFYTEILYDEKGYPEFFFHKAFGYDGKPLEWRFYWKNGKLVRQLAPETIDTEIFPDSVPTPQEAYDQAVRFSTYLDKL